MNQETASKIVDEIISELNDRNGFDTRTLDEDIQEEIRETWIDIVITNLNKLAIEGGKK